jgi:hypothetical protein
MCASSVSIVARKAAPGGASNRSRSPISGLPDSAALSIAEDVVMRNPANNAAIGAKVRDGTVVAPIVTQILPGLLRELAAYKFFFKKEQI